MSALNKLVKTGKDERPPRVLVYGVDGVGKTTLATTFPTPIFLPTEDGLGSVEVARFDLITTWPQFKEACTALIEEKHEFGTVVLDSVDWLERIIQSTVAANSGKRNIEEIGYGKGYILCLDYWSQALKWFDALRDKGIVVLILGHAEIKRFDDPENDSYDEYRIKLHKSAGPVVAEWADAVLFYNYVVDVKKTESGFGKVKTRAVGAGDRALHTQKRPAFHAKNRYNMPEVIEPTWEGIARYL